MRSDAEIPLDGYLLGIETGKSPLAESRPAGEGEWGVLKVSAVQSGRFQPMENKAIQSAEHVNPHLQVRSGDLLMTRANTEALVGLACIAENPPQRLMLSDKTLRLIVDKELADPTFLALALLRPATRQQIAAMATGTSAGMKNISQSQVRQLHLPNFPLAHQRQIVATHATFEQRIQALEKSLRKLLTIRPVTLSTPRIETVQEVTLGSILKEQPKNGYSPQEAPGWTGLLALGLGCLTPEGFQPRQLKNVPDSAMARRFLVADGDLLMSRANTRELVGLVGRYSDVGQPCIYPDLMMRLRPDPQHCLPEFLELILLSDSVRRVIRTSARGTSESMVKINGALVEELRIPLPSLVDQRKIVATHATFERRISSLQQRVAKLRTLQVAVTESLLSGRS